MSSRKHASSPASRRSLLAPILAMGTAALAAACGGGAPPTNAPAGYGGSEAPDPTSIEQAQEQIARASEELGTSPAQQQPAAPPADQADTSSESAMREPKPSARAESKSESACASQCRALASMRRAVVALCRMTGADDARCKDATRTLTTSEQRVSACSC